MLLRRIDKTAECSAVATGQAVCDRPRWVVPMSDVRDRVERESEQQAGNGDS